MDTPQEKTKKLLQRYKEIYYVRGEPLHIKLLLASVLSVYTVGDPVWLMLVGGAGVGKTESLRIFDKVDICHPISELSENTFLSGMAKKKGGEETSLLHRIGVLGVMIIKDFTTILSMRADKRISILAQLREIYDGKFTKQTGTGVNPTWKGKMGVIGAVTTAYYDYIDEIDKLGPRFVFYALEELTKRERKLLLKRQRALMPKIDGLRAELADLTEEIVNEYKQVIPTTLDPIPNDVVDTIEDLSEFVSRARSPVTRNRYNVITNVHDAESPTRMFNAPLKLGQILQFMNDGEWKEEDEQAIYKMLIDSIPMVRRKILLLMYRYNEVKASAIGKLLHLPSETVRNALEELNAHGVVEKAHVGGNVLVWMMQRDYADLLLRIYKQERISGSLEVDDDDDDDFESTQRRTFTGGFNSGDVDGVASEEASAALDLEFDSW